MVFGRLSGAAGSEVIHRVGSGAEGLQGLGACAWRFMGSYQWGYKSSNMGYKYSYPTYNPTITTHEPPSGGGKHHKIRTRSLTLWLPPSRPECLTSVIHLDLKYPTFKRFGFL